LRRLIFVWNDCGKHCDALEGQSRAQLRRAVEAFRSPQSN
jgi:hypothetical protein